MAEIVDTNNFVTDPDWYKNNPKDRLSILARSSKGYAAQAQRSRTPTELSRRSPLIRAIVRGFKNNIVGVGVEVDFFGGSDAFRKRYQERFNCWADSSTPDFHNDTNCGGMQGFIVNAMYIDHGAFIVRYVERVGTRFELRLRIIGQSWIDQSKGEKGIEKDAFGRVTGYHIYNNIDRRSDGSTLYQKDLEIIHVRIMDDPESILGVSELTSSIRSHSELTDLNNARVTQQTVAAMLSLIVKGLKSPEARIGMKNLLDEDYIEPGMIAYLDQEEAEIETINPPNIQGGQEIETALRRDAAIGSGSTYEVATGDFSRVNFASGRFSKQEYKLHIRVIQHHVLKIAISKIVGWWIDVDSLNSRVRMPNDFKWNLHFPEGESISPKEDLDVDIKKVRNGAMSPQDFARKHGVNFNDLVNQWEEAKAMLDEAGIILDIDASRVSAAGNIQAADETDNNNNNSNSSNNSNPSSSSEEEDNENNAGNNNGSDD